MSVIRRHGGAGTLTATQAYQAVVDLLDLPVAVFAMGPLLRRAWVLREDITSYDACCVALAEALACTLLTADVRLANAPGAKCTIEII